MLHYTYEHTQMFIRYGKVTTEISRCDYKDTKTVVTYTERIPVENEQDILSAFLRLHKNYKSENLHNIELKLIEKNDKPQFVDISWSEIELAC